MALREGITIVKEVGMQESCWIDRGNGNWERIISDPNSTEGAECDVGWNTATAIQYIEDTRGFLRRMLTREPENMRYGPEGRKMIQVNKPETVYIVRSGLRRKLTKKEANNLTAEQLGNNLYVVRNITRTTDETRANLANIETLFETREDRFRAMGTEVEKEIIDATFASLIERNVLICADNENIEAEDPEKGHVYIINQTHFSPWAEVTNDEVDRIYQVYQAVHALQIKGVPIFEEGTKQDQSVRESSSHIDIDGTNLFDREIQKQLFDCDNHDGFSTLVQLISQYRGEQGTIGLQEADFLRTENIYGIEGIELFQRMDDIIKRKVKAKDIRSRVVLNISSNIVVVGTGNECHILIGNNPRKFKLTELIENLQFLHELSKDMIQLSADREQAVVQYTKDLLKYGIHPVIVYGAAHELSLREALSKIANVHSYRPTKMTKAHSDKSVSASKNQAEILEFILHEMKEIALKHRVQT